MNYLLVGPEEYLKHRFVERLKKSVLNAGRNHPDFEIFRGGESEVARIRDSSKTLPFTAKGKLILIKNIGKFSEKEKQSILEYVKSVPKSTTLVLESQANRLDKFLTEISKSAKVIKCDRLRAERLDAWITEEFEAHGKKISPAGRGLLKELAGGGLFLLKNEINKAASFAGNAPEVNEKHIEAVSGKETYKMAFRLVSLVLEKRMDKILLFIEDLLAKEKPHQILSLLAWQFRNFIRIKGLPKNARPEEIARALGINRYFAVKMCEESRRFTPERLERNLAIALEADFFIKTGKFDPQHALERALFGLCE